MLYTKIRLDFKYGPKNRFYRIVLIKGNPDLFKLGVILGTCLGATFEHCFLITCKNNVSYVMAPFMEDPMDGYKYLGKYHLNDLPENFNFEYDTGDGWDFKCKKYNQLVERKDRKNVIILEGKGQGIWEDNIGSLYALFSGKVSPNTTEPDEENGYYLPWNFSNEKFGDFDLPLDIEELNDDFYYTYKLNYDEILKSENEYIKECKVSLDDYHMDYSNNPYDIRTVEYFVNNQIETDDDVKDIYNELSNLLGEEKAKSQIAITLTSYLIEISNNNGLFNEEEYKNRLKIILNSLKIVKA